MPVKKRALILLCGGLAVCLHAAAQESTSRPIQLTADSAVEYAVRGNISLKKSEISLQAAKRARNYSWNSVSPSLSSSASLRKTLPEKDSGTAAAAASNAANLTLGASINIGLSPSLYTSIRGAVLSYEKQQLDYAAAVRTIELNVRKAFYSILYEQENVALRKNSADSAQKQYASNLAKYNRGLLPRLDVLNSQISYQNARLALENAQTTLLNDMATFKQMLGLPQDTELSVSGSLDAVLDLPELDLAAVQKNSSTISSLEKQLAIARNNLLAARLNAYAPSLSAGYSYSFARALEENSEWTHGGTLSLGLTLPLDGILPWSKSAQGIATQKDSIRTLQLELDDAKTTLEVSTQGYLNKIRQLQAALALQKSSVDYAKESYALTIEAYNSGTKDHLVLQTAADNLLQAEVNLKSQAYSLIAALLELENSIGAPFGTFGIK